MRAAHIVSVVLILGCGRYESERSQLQLGIEGNVSVLRQALEMQVTASQWSLFLQGVDIMSAAGANSTRVFDTPRSGELRVEAVLRNAAREIVSSGAISLEIRRDWRWGVVVWLGNQNPLGTCFGCMGAKAFPVAASFRSNPDDSLYLAWGGNSIENPVVY